MGLCDWITESNGVDYVSCSGAFVPDHGDPLYYRRGVSSVHFKACAYREDDMRSHTVSVTLIPSDYSDEIKFTIPMGYDEMHVMMDDSLRGKEDATERLMDWATLIEDYYDQTVLGIKPWEDR